MAKLKEIMEIEAQRPSLDACRVVHLFQEGTFYRAYEWSAWLCIRYVQDFKPTKRKFKSEDSSMVFIGFPVTSLQKYTPEGGTVTSTDDKRAELVLPEALFQEVTDVGLLQSDFNNWKESIPLSESTKKENDIAGRLASEVPLSSLLSRPSRITDVMHLLLAYPIEQKSPMECMQFLAEVKKSIAEFV